MPVERLEPLEPPEPLEVSRTIDAVWKIESPKLIASLARMTRDVGLAEVQPVPQHEHGLSPIRQRSDRVEQLVVLDARLGL